MSDTEHDEYTETAPGAAESDPLDELEHLDHPEVVPVPATVGELQAAVDDLILAVEAARSVPLSGSVMLDRGHLLDMLYGLRDRLPEELRTARWMVREREAFVGQTNEKARETLDKARIRSDELISESHIVKEAVEEANQLMRLAESDATRIRLEAEDLSEQVFEEAEGVLAELLAELRRSRAKLHQARDPDIIH